MVFVTVVLLLAVLVLFYLYLTWKFSYWQKLGVKGPKPWPLVGNFPRIPMQKRHMVYDLDDIYRKFKKTEDFVGVFHGRDPILLITSPALAHRVFVTDFLYFNANAASLMLKDNSDFNIFANNPFTLTGQKWQEKRAELIPGLSLGRVKTGYSVTNRVSKRMTDYIREQTVVASTDGLDAKDICLRFTSEVITDCVFGVNADSFGKRPTPILGMITTIFQVRTVLYFYFIIVWIFPILKRFYKFRVIPKPTEDFFTYLMQNSIDFCKSQKNLKSHQNRNNFLDDMFQLQEKKNLSTSQLASHTLIFMMKGFENIAAVIAHCLLMLARFPSIQDKVRSEFEGHLDENGVVNFDALVELSYLDACIHETLRIFTPGFLTNKICTEPIELTNKNGQTLRVRKGEVVTLPLYSFMLDEDYYPNPQEFQPERFLKENGGVLKYRNLGVYFGFGDGPRRCLGMQFALVQSKAAIVEVLRNFNIRVNPKTRKDNTWSPKTFHPQLDGGIWLDFEVRNLVDNIVY